MLEHYEYTVNLSRRLLRNCFKSFYLRCHGRNATNRWVSLPPLYTKTSIITKIQTSFVSNTLDDTASSFTFVSVEPNVKERKFVHYCVLSFLLLAWELSPIFASIGWDEYVNTFVYLCMYVCVSSMSLFIDSQAIASSTVFSPVVYRASECLPYFSCTDFVIQFPLEIHSEYSVFLFQFTEIMHGRVNYETAYRSKMMWTISPSVYDNVCEKLKSYKQHCPGNICASRVCKAIAVYRYRVEKKLQVECVFCFKETCIDFWDRKRSSCICYMNDINIMSVHLMYLLWVQCKVAHGFSVAYIMALLETAVHFWMNMFSSRPNHEWWWQSPRIVFVFCMWHRANQCEWVREGKIAVAVTEVVGVTISVERDRVR